MQLRRFFVVRQMAHSIMLADSVGVVGEPSTTTWSSQQLKMASRGPEMDRTSLQSSNDEVDSRLRHRTRHETERASTDTGSALAPEGDHMTHAEQSSRPLSRHHVHRINSGEPHNPVDFLLKNNVDRPSSSEGHALESGPETQLYSYREFQRTPEHGLNLPWDRMLGSSDQVLRIGAKVTEAAARWPSEQIFNSTLSTGSLGCQLTNAMTGRQNVGVSKSVLDRSTESAIASGKSTVIGEQSLALT